MSSVEALVVEQPGVGVLDDGANDTKTGAVLGTNFPDQRLDAFAQAEPAIIGAVVAGMARSRAILAPTTRARRSNSGNIRVSWTFAAEATAPSGNPSLETTM
jgi:hypothetical protein